MEEIYLKALASRAAKDETVLASLPEDVKSQVEQLINSEEVQEVEIINTIDDED